MINSYGKVIALDKGRYTAGVFDAPVTIQEKLDGSQVSFQFDGTQPYVRSKNCEAGGKQFQMVIDWVKENADKLNRGYVYRGEAITSLKHNTLTYERVPVGGVVLYDIYNSVADCMLSATEVQREAKRLGLEAVQTFLEFAPSDVEYAKACALSGKPMLGGEKMEGVVVKQYLMPDPTLLKDSAECFLKVKYVNESFKEVHHKDWKDRNPGTKDVINNLIEMYGTEARLAKAVQHLRDDGKLTDSVKDIGALIGEVARDIKEECEEELKEALWKHFSRPILRGISNKMPAYYKTTHLGIEG